MRIAYILNTLETGGAERQILALAERMRARGHAVALLVLRDTHPNDLSTDLDVVHLRITRNPLTAVSGFARALRAVRGLRPDVIHGNQFHGNMLGRMLRIATRVPVISTIHNEYEGGRARMLAYRVTDPLANRNVAVCSVAAERFATIRACAPRKLGVIGNGIDLAGFAPDQARRARVRAEMNAGDSFVWLAACRLTPAKDIPNLLRAFALVRCEERGTQLWIAGEGSAAYVAELKRLSRSLANDPTVRWLGTRSDIAALLDAADGFVLSSAWEGLPLALGEAMAMEKPFVATDVGGVRELAGECGALIPARDAAALADAMLATMRTPAAQRSDAGRAARARIEKHFNLDEKASEWERLYLDVAAE